MGLFDIPAPLFGAIDGLLGFLPAYARLLLWAAITGALSMLFYWLCSAQEKVESAKQRAIKGRKEMAGNPWSQNSVHRTWNPLGKLLC